MHEWYERRFRLFQVIPNSIIAKILQTFSSKSYAKIVYYISDDRLYRILWSNVINYEFPWIVIDVKADCSRRYILPSKNSKNNRMHLDALSGRVGNRRFMVQDTRWLPLIVSHVYLFCHFTIFFLASHSRATRKFGRILCYFVGCSFYGGRNLLKIWEPALSAGKQPAWTAGISCKNDDKRTIVSAIAGNHQREGSSR